MLPLQNLRGLRDLRWPQKALRSFIRLIGPYTAFSGLVSLRELPDISRAKMPSPDSQADRRAAKTHREDSKANVAPARGKQPKPLFVDIALDLALDIALIFPLNVSFSLLLLLSSLCFSVSLLLHLCFPRLFFHS